MNSMYFNKAQVEDGDLAEFLSLLLKQSYGESDTYNDIHIYPADLGAWNINWSQEPWDHSYGGRFAYIDENKYVVEEFNFPDGHYELFESEEEYKEKLEEWLKENPTWHKNEWGIWTEN